MLVRTLLLSDLANITRIHQAAFPDSALTALGPEAVQRYYRWQLTGPHDAVALGAMSDSNFTAFCFAGVFRGAVGGFLRANRTFLAYRVLTHPWLLSNPLFRERLGTSLNLLRRIRGQQYPTTTPPTLTSPSFGILSIAVDPTFQGVGIGKTLLMEAERTAAERGFALMNLTVHPSNKQAVSFYERMGWEKVEVASKWNGRMQKRLPSMSKEAI